MGRMQQTSDEEILRIARLCFEEFGPQVSTSEIARRLNISQATLFSRFGTKKTLLIAAMAPRKNLGWLERLRQGPIPGSDVREELISLASEFQTFFKEILPAVEIMRSAGITSYEIFQTNGDESLPQIAFDEWRSWLERAQARGLLAPTPAAPLALALMGAVQAWPFLKGYFPVENGISEDSNNIAAWIEAVWHGLAPKIPA